VTTLSFAEHAAGSTPHRSAAAATSMARAAAPTFRMGTNHAMTLFEPPVTIIV